MSDATVLVRGRKTDSAQIPLWAEQLRLEFRLSRPGVGAAESLADGVLVSQFPVVVTPDENGEFTVRLIPNDVIKGDSFYQVRATYLNPGGRFTSLDLYRIFVPMTGGWVSDLVNPAWRVAQILTSPVRPDPWPVGSVWINSITGDQLRNEGTKVTYLGNLRGMPGAQGKPGPAGLPGVNAVENDAAVAAYLLSDSSQVQAALDEVLTARARVFDFGSAMPEFGVLMSAPRGDGPKVMQSVMVVRALGGELWYSQVSSGTVSGRESTRVVRCNPSGGLIGEMILTDAGHGTGVNVEVDAAGTIWVWSSVIDYAKTGDAQHFTTRVPWSSGSQVSTATMWSYRVPQISGAGYKTCHYDADADLVGVRSNVGTSYRFEVFHRAQLLQGTAASLHTCTVTVPVTTVQGWAYLDGAWYILGGSSPETSPYAPLVIYRYDADTGALVSQRLLESVRKGPTGEAPAGWTEPEGLTVGRGPKGEPSLVFGMSMGPLGGRGYAMFSLNMGVSPFTSQVLAMSGRAYGDTDYRYDAMLTWAAGFSGDSDTLAPWRAGIVNGKLELIGVVNGVFQPGTNVVGQLREGFYNPYRNLRGAIATASPSGATSNTARAEVTSSGQVQVYIPIGSVAVSWVDFNGFVGTMGRGGR